MTYQMGKELQGVRRCPHCGVSHPRLSCVYAPSQPFERSDGGQSHAWMVYVCASCGDLIIARSYGTKNNGPAEYIYPEPRRAHEDIPSVARTFLQQAFDTLHAPDAAAMVSGSAVDAMLKELGLIEGTLYARIDQALEQNLITKGMAEWAHEVRLGSNRPRHADIDNPHVSADEARQSVEFASALANFLFVITARIERGTEAAKAASAST